MSETVSLTASRKARLKVLGWVAIASMLALVILGPTAGGASAVAATTNLHQTPPIASTDPAFQGTLDECADANLAAGQVLWHFVLVQTASGTAGSYLHATFTGAGDVDNVLAYKKAGGVLHWNIITGADTLTGAHTNRAGAYLNLSHICQGPPLTTTTTTTTTTTNSSTTTTNSSTATTTS